MKNNYCQPHQLDSASVSLLFDLKESGNPRIEAVARGLLVKGGFLTYIETMKLPDFIKTSKIHLKQNSVETINIKEDKLWLFPNPAKDYLIACYDLNSKNNEGAINLFNIKGNLLSSYGIKGGKNQIVIDLKAYPNGLYLISLNSRNQVLDSKKLSKGGF